MTVAANLNPVSTHTGNGSTTEFVIGWDYKDDIGVYVDGVEVPFIASGDGIKAVISPAPAVDATIVLRRATDIVQLTDFVDLQKFPGNAVEEAVDRLTDIAQEHDANFGRTMMAPPGTPKIDLPYGEDLTGKLLLGVSANALEAVSLTSLAVAIDPNLPVSAVPSFVLQTLKSLPPMLDGTVVNTSGYWTFGDGGHGTYIWAANSTAADNGVTVIARAAVGDGRYLLQYDSVIRIRQAGARDNTQSTADQMPYIQACHDAFPSGGIIWIDATVVGVGFIVETSAICRRGRMFRGIPNFSQLDLNDNFPDHAGVFEQDMTHEEGRFYQHNVHMTWLWLSGLVIDMRGKDGPCRARKLRRHFTYTDCSYLYIRGNPNYPQNSLTAYHTDKSILNGAESLPSACFLYHDHETNVVSDDCFAPAAYEMLGMNFPGLGRLANNITISGGRIHGFITAVHLEGHDNLIIDLLTNPPLGDANDPINLNEGNMRYMGKVSAGVYSDAEPNGHNVRFNFPRGRTNRLISLWVERIDGRGAVRVDNASSSKLSGVMVDNCTAIEHPEQVIDTVKPLGFRAVYTGADGTTGNQVEIVTATGASVDELENFPKGARIVVHSFDADRRDGVSIEGHARDGHSHTTIAESVYSGGKTLVTVMDAVCDQWTAGAEREDVATRIDDTTLTINGNWEVQFGVGEKVSYHKPNHGFADSHVVSRSHGPHPTDPAGYPAGVTTIVTVDPIVTEGAGIAFSHFDYNRNPFRYANKIFEPEITSEIVNVRQVLHAAGFVNGSVDGAEECTITGGNLNISSGNLEVLAASGTADNLDKITGLNEDGAIIHLRLGLPGIETITVRQNMGGNKAIYTNTGADIVMTAAHHEMMLRYNLLMDRWVHIGGNTV